ncbi:MAG: AmmeMemoRadiSam system protein A [Spirochaetaceae bacterium]|jgi:AmmeMemoRadiSam system protein A|nr:AmmeMemoRadiSam system protein A [Spirochaetaceae bacterium]
MPNLNENEKKDLLQFARKNISYLLGLEKNEPLLEMTGDRCGAFVTLKKENNLRGCIGNIISDRPLSETIKEMSKAAAFRDPRFLPLKIDEFDKISIEISIISPMEKVEDLTKIKTGRDGLYIKNAYHSGLLLPQVAREQNWDRETFINQTFIKAGLSPDYINDKDTEIFTFTAEVFSEVQY